VSSVKLLPSRRFHDAPLSGGLPESGLALLQSDGDPCTPTVIESLAT
jgi:hypothetical protein